MLKTHTTHIRFNTLIWLILIALTLATYNIDQLRWSGKATMMTILVITLIKSQMVANFFMGLNKTKTIWRVIMLVYFLIVGGLIAYAYLLGSN
jgi:cytochrome c oxidase subunit IV